MVGADLSGIELRMLVNISLNMMKDATRTFYSTETSIKSTQTELESAAAKLNSQLRLSHGAGNTKIGLSYDSTLSEGAAKKKGAEIRQAFVSAIDGLEELLKAIKRSSQKGYVKSIDGRPIKVDSQHKSLNYLLQSGAGCVAKRWMVLANEEITNRTYLQPAAFVHDDCSLKPPLTMQLLSALLERSAKHAGEYYNLRIPIAAEASVGHSWAETH